MTAEKINFRQAEFLLGAPRLDDCPDDDGHEVAFAGRSNSGKSSAINRLTGNSKLARTSKTPGRTQMINFFEVLPNVRLADLPGYGFAKVPLAVKRKWEHNLEEYLSRRQSLRGLVLMMDIRHPLKDFDKLMLDWAIRAQMPVHCLLTKADKLKRGAQKTTLMQVQKTLEPLAPMVSVQLFSSLKGDGVDTLATYLDHWLTDVADEDESLVDESAEITPENTAGENAPQS